MSGLKVRTLTIHISSLYEKGLTEIFFYFILSMYPACFNVLF